ncbi:acyltransferase family protein [Listeria costaricensis]|uniref:acyltransferase family protein n=1 Tax=Listeria costaricensis TaxID=2026604 RepID=UPI000C06B3B5|nr:acyltransferase family protein [Listeria costaricensis]
MAAKKPKERDYYFDNAKFILIFLVVFGHLLQTFIAEYENVRILYLYIYTFHMPAFILMSGYFAKGFRKKGYLSKTIKKLILPYLIFQLIYSIFYYFLLGEDSLSLKILDPEWSMWFLLSLCFWNLMLYLFARFSAKKGLVIAFSLGLLAGYFDMIGGYLSLSRTFVFFPFFLVGFFMTKEHFKLLQTRSAKLVGMLVTLLILGFIILNPEMNEDWFLGSKPYDKLVDVKSLGMLIRLAVYGISFLSVFAFFTFVPKRRLFFTKWGKNTLYVYLLHGFFIKTFREDSAFGANYSLQTFVILLGVSFCLTILLSSSLVTTFVQPVIELRISRLRTLFSRLKEKLLPNQSY